ncbi:hypothetical protein [Weissella confusa]|uniref:hypothetical protein n=1 Tax=Weissella confusa TaxID=1583 RepID=UPI00189CDE34|nr:hypothetical protein [Weissella confusa]MBF7058605.1 hypothetical protein [Weissella confusa]MBJ7643126.1 hypothetical protein [Weissella confusa]MDY2511637.1 hypothetical protein [Weissella confusa]
MAKQNISSSKNFSPLTVDAFDRELSHYALKEDVEKLKADLQKDINTNTRWLIGLGVTIAIAIFTILFGH